MFLRYFARTRKGLLGSRPTLATVSGVYTVFRTLLNRRAPTRLAGEAHHQIRTFMPELVELEGASTLARPKQSLPPTLLSIRSSSYGNMTSTPSKATRVDGGSSSLSHYWSCSIAAFGQASLFKVEDTMAQIKGWSTAISSQYLCRTKA